MNNVSQVQALKKKAGDSLRLFCVLADDYDCGQQMVKEINPKAAAAAARYNEAMTELRRIDPMCPEFKPL